MGDFYTSTMIVNKGWSNLAKSLKQFFCPPQKVIVNSKLNVSHDDRHIHQTTWTCTMEWNCVESLTRISPKKCSSTKNLQFIPMFWRTSFLTFCPNSKYISPNIHGTTRLHVFHVIIEKTPNISTHAQLKNTTITWTKHGPERSPSQKWTAPRSPRPGEFTWLPRKHTPDSLDSLPLILSSLSLPLSLYKPTKNFPLKE